MKITNRVQTRDRAVDWRDSRQSGGTTGSAGSFSDFESAASLKRWVEPTTFIPTDGIVRKTASQITKGARTDGNWMAYNTAADVTLSGATGRPLPFLMYPQAQSRESHYDPYDPDNFTYTITAHEIHAA